MRARITVMAVVSLAVALLFGAQLVLAQEQGAQGDAETQKMMAAWQKYMTPGKFHEAMNYFTGDWEVVNTMWMTPGAEPQMWSGTATYKMMLGGRYLHGSFTGTFMGQPFQGYSIQGYDNYRKEYVTIWIDNMGTGIYELRGQCDADCKVTTLSGVWDDPIAGGKSRVRDVTTIVDENSFKMEMFQTGPDGKEFKSMEGMYTRKKKM